MKFSKNPKIVVAGSVNSSRVTLEKLIEHEMNIAGVLGVTPAGAKNVSDYNNLSDIALNHNLKFKYFENINDQDIVRFIKDTNPDLLFVVGLSQLVKKKLLNIPNIGCIGFHPTRLPEGRGRGAVAWLILGKAKGAATFFKLDEGTDSGPIIVQEPFQVYSTDYAGDVIDKIIDAIETALDRELPKIKNGNLEFNEQDHSKATYLGRRRPQDGLINWQNGAEEIHTLIRAVSKPLPGAYTYFNGQKITIQKASIYRNSNRIGVPGRIISIDIKRNILVQTGVEQLLIEDFEGITEEELKVGVSFGLNYEREIQNLKREVESLKKKTNYE